jgi:hypothetical protein
VKRRITLQLSTSDRLKVTQSGLCHVLTATVVTIDILLVIIVIIFIKMIKVFRADLTRAINKMRKRERERERERENLLIGFDLLFVFRYSRSTCNSKHNLRDEVNKSPQSVTDDHDDDEEEEEEEEEEEG